MTAKGRESHLDSSPCMNVCQALNKVRKLLYNIVFDASSIVEQPSLPGRFSQMSWSVLGLNGRDS